MLSEHFFVLEVLQCASSIFFFFLKNSTFSCNMNAFKGKVEMQSIDYLLEIHIV